MSTDDQKSVTAEPHSSDVEEANTPIESPVKKKIIFEPSTLEENCTDETDEEDEQSRRPRRK